MRLLLDTRASLGWFAGHEMLSVVARDPFDHMLISEAMLDDLVLVSNERAFDAYGARRLG
jgi:PIN domain nuclease of toxin-antitoxin system